MRKTVWVVAVSLALVSGDVLSASPKAPPADVGSGRVAWFDITTTDLPRSKDFYGKLFDWQFTPVAASDQALEIVSGGTAIGTLRVADGKSSVFNGVVYVQVADLPASCKKRPSSAGRSRPVSRSICPTAPEPSRSSRTLPAIRWAFTRGPCCRRAHRASKPRPPASGTESSAW